MKKGQFFIITAVLISLILIPSIMVLKMSPRRESNNICFFLFDNTRSAFKNTVNLSLEQDPYGNTLDANLGNLSSKFGQICDKSNYIKCNLNYSLEKLTEYIISVVLFEDDFEGYNYTEGLQLYAEMSDHGWGVDDFTHPWNDDDIYLNESGGNYYISIQDNSNIFTNVTAEDGYASFNTTGYENINLTYTRRSYRLESWQGDDFRIEWRVGSSGGWTILEETHNGVWETKTWNLSPSADDEEMIQVKFVTDGFGDFNTDFGHMDDFIASGDEISGEPSYNVTLNLTVECKSIYLHDAFTYIA